MATKFTIYTDGAARGNPGHSASGYLLYEGSDIMREHLVYNGIRTNNYAEYNAVLLALEWCTGNIDNPSKSSIELYSDSELVVRQLNGSYKMRSKSLKPFNDKIKRLSRRFGSVKFLNVRREDPNISRVDKSLNMLLDSIERSNA